MMALRSKKFFSILSLFIVALLTVPVAGDVWFNSSSYTVGESEGYIVVEVCPLGSAATMESSGSGMSESLTVYITSEGQTASKLKSWHAF
jgi:hypothetical protein